ncbi:ClpP protease-like protein [Edaphobacter aggregans]|uniref:ATP-dependent Clp protease proteolytic subunit n=1 Tax=Edaphobacter aggregans TaxID=570835 RepID=A0A3R9QCZ1_9BACT|nr:ATP-dependent Clp protease proteolytic subunit [Edaphobacter aggregans]RSL18710.1 ClpP protease-like protein [Edaphobacter aggregans]
MATKIAAYRENPNRAIFITGEINQAMVDRLTPQIIQLQRADNEPITVYIDSPGGSTYHAGLLLQLLKNRDQDGLSVRIITVVTGLAASAAADILAAGDYAIAYRHAIIHFHGVRTSRGDAITHESASSLAEALRQTNESYALELAQEVLGRFMFIYMQLSSEFESVREEKHAASDVECLAESITAKLGGISSLLTLAVDKHKQLCDLLEHYSQELEAQVETFSRPALKEAFLLKFLIHWELGRNQEQDWRFRSDGLNAIREDFVLLADYEDGTHMSNLDQLTKRWGVFLLDGAQRLVYDGLPTVDRPNYIHQQTKDRFRHVWHFLVSVCRALQQGENRLTATNAYWLGLIDEVPGTKLATIREMLENRNDIVAEPSPSSGNQKKPTKVAKKKSIKTEL